MVIRRVVRQGDVIQGGGNGRQVEPGDGVDGGPGRHPAHEGGSEAGGGRQASVPGGRLRRTAGVGGGNCGEWALGRFVPLDSPLCLGDGATAAAGDFARRRLESDTWTRVGVLPRPQRRHDCRWRHPSSPPRAAAVTTAMTTMASRRRRCVGRFPWPVTSRP